VNVLAVYVFKIEFFAGGPQVSFIIVVAPHNFLFLKVSDQGKNSQIEFPLMHQ